MSELQEKKEKKEKKLNIKTICYCSLMTALSVVANIYTINFSIGGSNAVSFTYTVCFLGGAFFGPMAGFFIGVCGDVIGWLINPSGGAFNPVIPLITGLIGVISGLVFYIAKRCGKGNAVITLTIISYVFILLICTNLNTVAIYFYYMASKYSFKAYYILRVPKQIVFWAINMIICVVVVKPMKKILKL